MISFLKEKIKNKNLNFVDLIEGIPKFSNDNHYKKSIELWGKGNHSSNKDKHDGGDTHIEKIIEHFGDEDFKKENFLEIGCGEGIDLKGVSNIFILDPVWNYSKLQQIIGRGVRYNSHIHLPPKQRHVDIYKLVLQ